MGKVKNYDKPKYWLYALISVCCVLLLLGMVWLIMAFCSPVTLAGIVNKTGWNSYAHTLYMRDYNKSHDINSVYLATTLSIKAKNYDAVVNDFETLETHEKYNDFIKAVDKHNLSTNASLIERASMYSEDDYLKNCYVLALVKAGSWDKAFDKARGELDGVTPTVEYFGNYLFEYLVANMGEHTDLFNDVLNDLIKPYFDNLVDVFDTQFSVEKEVQCFALCNRMMKVGNDIITIEKALGHGNSALVQSVNAKLGDVASAMQTLLGE